MHTDTGTTDIELLLKNLNLAITVYINRVNGCPCGDKPICLYRGADNSECYQVRDKLLAILNGSREAKEALQQEYPEIYAEIHSVWDVRNHHTARELPNQYTFWLLCCFKPDCSHPLCKRGEPSVIPIWYPGGPPIMNLPLPIADTNRPRRNSSCDTCKEFCAGHYKVKYVDVREKSATASCMSPPLFWRKNFLSWSGVLPQINTWEALQQTCCWVLMLLGCGWTTSTLCFKIEEKRKKLQQLN